LELSLDAEGRVTKAVGHKASAPAYGLACVKGINAHLQLGHAERLSTPLKRVAGGFQPISWDEAVSLAGAAMRKVQAQHGPDAMALYGSGALTNEAIYLLAKFGRTVLRTANMDYNGRYCMSSAAAAHNIVLGLDRGLPFPLEDLQLSKVIVLIGANVAETLPPIAQQLRKAKAGGCKLVVLDPRMSATASLADLHLKPKPGTDLAVGVALLEALRLRGALDQAYLGARTRGWEQALEAAAGFDAAACEGASGVTPQQLDALAALCAGPKPVLFLTARGAEQHVRGPETAMAFLQVALALGQVGLPGGGFGTLTGQGNGQGGREQGQKADQLPGYRLLADPQHRAEVAAHWGVAPESLPQPGLSAQELFSAKHRPAVRGLWVVAANPAMSAANAREARASLEGLDFLMVSDLFMSETARLAHLVLPAAAFAEEAGTMTNLEGRVLLRQAVTPPPGQAKPDWKALCLMAAELGHGERFAYPDVAAVFDDLAACTAGGRADYSGLRHATLDPEHGAQWPAPRGLSQGTPRVFGERFAHADGLAHLQPLAWAEHAEAPDADYPFRLTTGRVLAHYLTGTQTRRLPPLNKQAPAAWLEISPEAAGPLGLGDGQHARVSTRRGHLDLPVRLKPGQEASTLFVPMHFPDDGCANDLTSDALAPLSKMPAFKACAAQVVAL
jgi:assimilatory nitrate reductase catalytic subunit